ncbi:hypothetical protein [Planomonospora sp. ID82291]|uniref:hypothetical protein n=1 Tax=Planomonospora sp. ID82291 TaxID=2738136 RepID=UPI0018C40004|nr:hypothetical protein [Planomonospora sp. ID82291]MBG0818345.1 hypothetical protein [Planomonospora sp. ID82291]
MAASRETVMAWLEQVAEHWHASTPAPLCPARPDVDDLWISYTAGVYLPEGERARHVGELAVTFHARLVDGSQVATSARSVSLPTLMGGRS